MATKSKHNFELEDRDYSSVELAEMIGRNKSRINQLARQHHLGHKEVHGKTVFWKFGKKDVDWLLNWLAENGHPLNAESRRIQAEMFNGLGRFQKPSPSSKKRKK